MLLLDEERMAAARQRLAEDEGGGDRLREFRLGVIKRAMATMPEKWPDELKGKAANPE